METDGPRPFYGLLASCVGASVWFTWQIVPIAFVTVVWAGCAWPGGISELSDDFWKGDRPRQGRLREARRPEGVGAVKAIASAPTAGGTGYSLNDVSPYGRIHGSDGKGHGGLAGCGDGR
jgi:hypothetical protein